MSANLSNLRIEWKSFSFKRNKDSLTMTEMYRNGCNSFTMHSDVAQWIGRQIPDSFSEPNVQIARMRKNDLVVSLMPRTNRMGKFLSVLFVSKNLENGSKVLCIPLDKDATGWKNFKDSISEAAGGKSNEVDVATEPMGGTKHVLVKKGFEEKVDCMRERCVVLSTSSEVDWLSVPDFLNDILNLSMIPVIRQVGPDIVNMEMGNEKDVETLLKIPYIIMDSSEISFK